MIRHTVAFRLIHPAGSAAERDFLDAALALADIPGVADFERSAQVSPKNDLRFVFSMTFADRSAYDGYNVHPVHVAFVSERWVPEVEAFLEADWVPLESAEGTTDGTTEGDH